MSYSKSWQYNKNVYIFKLTRNAQVEIERIINNHQLKLASDRELAEMIPFIQDMEKIREEIEAMPEGKKKDNKMEEFIAKEAKMIAMSSKLSEYTSDPIELYEFGYILIKGYRKNPPLSREEYDMMCIEIEDALGLDGAIEMFKEMQDKVFYEMELINKLLVK